LTWRVIEAAFVNAATQRAAYRHATATPAMPYASDNTLITEYRHVAEYD